MIPVITVNHSSFRIFKCHPIYQHQATLRHPVYVELKRTVNQHAKTFLILLAHHHRFLEALSFPVERHLHLLEQVTVGVV